MKATIFVTFKDGTKQEYFDGDFFPWQFKHDIENRNEKFIKIGDSYVCKDEIRSASADIENEKENEQ